MKHILITGEIGAGKSTLIRRLLDTVHRPICGFYTLVRETGRTGEKEFFLHSARLLPEERFYTPENRIALCTHKPVEIYPHVFDCHGVTSLGDPRPGELVVMDELGFLESRSPLFQQRVLELLEGDIPVIAAVKSRPDVPFLEAVKSHPKTTLFHITPHNREELFATLVPVMEKL